MGRGKGLAFIFVRWREDWDARALSTSSRSASHPPFFLAIWHADVLVMHPNFFFSYLGHFWVVFISFTLGLMFARCRCTYTPLSRPSCSLPSISHQVDVSSPTSLPHQIQDVFPVLLTRPSHAVVYDYFTRAPSVTPAHPSPSSRPFFLLYTTDS